MSLNKAAFKGYNRAGEKQAYLVQSAKDEGKYDLADWYHDQEMDRYEPSMAEISRGVLLKILWRMRIRSAGLALDDLWWW